MIKQWFKCAIGAALISISATAFVHAEDVNLVGNKVETFINDNNQPSRLSALVAAALKDTPHSITATTQAWSGSGLRSGQFDGYIDHYSLNDPQRGFVYSQTYAQVNLHVASTDADAASMNRLDQLYRKRVGMENRFANTDQVRSQRAVNWARSPDFIGNMQQLAGQRVNYIVADKVMLDEMNKLLVAIDEEPLYISSKPLFVVDISLGMSTNFSNAQSVINALNEGIQNLKTSNEYDNIYLPDQSAPSTLDEALYEDILKRW
jgi:polar amino acid transport system substrate-binding protein